MVQKKNHHAENAPKRLIKYWLLIKCLNTFKKLKVIQLLSLPAAKTSV